MCMRPFPLRASARLPFSLVRRRRVFFARAQPRTPEKQTTQQHTSTQTERLNKKRQREWQMQMQTRREPKLLLLLVSIGLSSSSFDQVNHQLLSSTNNTH